MRPEVCLRICREAAKDHGPGLEPWLVVTNDNDFLCYPILKIAVYCVRCSKVID